MCVSETQTLKNWPRFDEIPEPRMVALYTANGSGTKLYQGFLDGHPQIYMIPAYPLMYFYPHWYQWQEELRETWNWETLINVLCIKHASVLDTRRIPGHDGLATLGEAQSEYLSIDENLFRAFLAHLLEGQPIRSRTFLLAVHYAYAFCRGEDLSQKRALIYHIHVHEYLSKYLIHDFPNMLVLGTVRDPRSNFHGRYNHSEVGVDLVKMNRTDALVYRRRVYKFIMRYFYEGLDILNGFPLERARVIRHEDLYYKLNEVMRTTAQFIGIDYHPCMEQITFGGRIWWGDKIYDMEPMNEVNPRVVSMDWQKRLDPIDWFVFEGLFTRYMAKYGYDSFKYHDSLVNRIMLFLTMLLPSQVEREVFLNYLRPSSLYDFLKACREEATGKVALKDYSFNAYYRHKWTQKDLCLYRPRWFVEFLKKAQRQVVTKPGSKALYSLKLAQCVYIAVNLCRYAWSILIYPVMIVKRWRVTGAAFRRMIANQNALPDTLP
jgi:hypothetical protein